MGLGVGPGPGSRRLRPLIDGLGFEGGGGFFSAAFIISSLRKDYEQSKK